MRDLKLGAAALGSILIGTMATAVHADIIGPVPSANPPLRIGKNAVNPQHLDLSWGDSCGPDQYDFAIYEGTIGTWYSHTKLRCTSGGVLGVSDVTPQAASSYYLAVALSPTAEGSYGKSSPNVEIPVGFETCRASQSTEACVWVRVFVSSAMYSGNLGGLSGADAKCQALANAAQLGGTWKAWLSDSTQNAATRLTHSSLSYRRIDGILVAANDVDFFSSTHASAIDVNEDGIPVGGSEVWTGSGGSGVGSGGCNDWTSTAGSFPAVGFSSLADSRWSNIYLQFCDRTNVRLYCVEQP